MKRKSFFKKAILIMALAVIFLTGKDVKANLQDELSVFLENEVQNNASMGYKKDAKLNVNTHAASGYFVYRIEETQIEDGKSDTVAIITDYLGKEETVTIPSTLEGKRVYEIGSGAFYQNTSVKKVIIPDSIGEISSGAFADCTNLATVVVGKKVHYFADYAFQNTKITSIEIPDCCYNISSIAFFRCANLTNVIISNNNQYYSSQDGVIFNKNKTILCSYLYGKKSTTYTIPNTVKTIPMEAIMNDYLQELTIPASVTEIRTDYFCFMTPNLKKTNVNSGNTKYCSVNGVLFSKDKTILYFYPSGLTNETYNIPSGTKKIAKLAFYDSKMKYVNIPSTVTEIEIYGFRYSNNLQEITLPSSITKLGNALFQDCPSLRKATVNANIETLPYLTFNTCSNLEEVIIKGNIKKIAKGVFYYCTKLTKVTLPDSLYKINEGAFWCCDALKNITIPKDVEIIEAFAFYDYRTSDHVAKTVLDISKTNLKKQDDGSYLAVYNYSVKGTRDYKKAYEVLDLVNKQRKAVGLSALSMDKDLLENAMLRAAEVVVEFSHTRPNNMSCSTAVTKTSYSTCAENIAKYATTSSSVMNSWMNSEGHKRNILLQNSTCIGIGCYIADDGSYNWVQLFTDGTANVPSSMPANKSTTESIKIAYSNIPFSDVSESSWYYSAVKYAVANKMIVGINSTKFSPNTNLTRGMIVTILHRMDGLKKSTITNKFTDVNSSKYYYEAVKWATEKGIVHGYNNTKFGPDDAIKRQDLAVILRNYARYKGKNINSTASLSSFSDYKKISSYAVDSMKWAVANGVITGNANTNTLAPLGTATRAEAASMLYKYCIKVK